MHGGDCFFVCTVLFWDYYFLQALSSGCVQMIALKNLKPYCTGLAIAVQLFFFFVIRFLKSSL